jgi:hypothetical protein
MGQDASKYDLPSIKMSTLLREKKHHAMNDNNWKNSKMSAHAIERQIRNYFT